MRGLLSERSLGSRAAAVAGRHPADVPDGRWSSRPPRVSGHGRRLGSTAGVDERVVVARDQRRVRHRDVPGVARASSTSALGSMPRSLCGVSAPPAGSRSRAPHATTAPGTRRPPRSCRRLQVERAIASNSSSKRAPVDQSSDHRRRRVTVSALPGAATSRSASRRTRGQRISESTRRQRRRRRPVQHGRTASAGDARRTSRRSQRCQPARARPRSRSATIAGSASITAERVGGELVARQ